MLASPPKEVGNPTKEEKELANFLHRCPGGGAFSSACSFCWQSWTLPDGPYNAKQEMLRRVRRLVKKYGSAKLVRQMALDFD